MENVQGNNEKAIVSSARESFLTAPLSSLMLRNILPSVASMLFMAVYMMVDGILVGRRLGPEALASVNILYPITALLAGLAVMIGVGGNTKIAILLGKGEVNKARGILCLITTIGAALGMIGSTVVFLAFPYILSFLGTSGSLGTYAGRYLKTLLLFFTPMILLYILEQSVRNDGHPNMASGVMLSSAILNIVLDYLFLFPLNLGIAGAALATGISQSIGALIFLGYFVYKTIRRMPGLRLGSTKGYWKEIGGISLNGCSELFNNLALGVTTFLYNRIILSYVGAMGVAAFTLVQYFLLFGSTIFIGMGNGTQPIISYNHGGGLSLRVKGTLKRLLTSSSLIGVLLFILLRWQMEALVTIFIPNHPEVLRLTLQVANYLSWSILFMPIGIIGSVYFTALEQAGKSLAVAASRSLVFTAIGLTAFPLLWGDFGIWITPVFTEGMAALVTALLIHLGSKKRYKLGGAIKLSSKPNPVQE